MGENLLFGVSNLQTHLLLLNNHYYSTEIYSHKNVKNPFLKGTKLNSIVRLKCPRCQEGNLFSVKNPYDLKHCIDMPDHCPVCNQDFRVEPGFYSGALWVSYPIFVVLIIPLAAGLILYTNLSIGWIFPIIAISVFGLQPIVMRISRAIWINVFVHYDAEISKKEKDSSR